MRFSSLRLSGIASAYTVVLISLGLSSAIYFRQQGADVDSGFINPLKPSYLYFLTYGMAAVFLVFAAEGRVRIRWGGLLPVMAALGILHLAWAPFVEMTAETSRILVVRLNVVAMAVCCQIILSVVRDPSRLLQAVRGVVNATCVLNALVVLAPDLFPTTMGVYPGRAAGLYWDPNQCATFLAMLLPIANLGLGRSQRALQSGAVLAGVLFTFSREGIVLWIAAVGLAELMRPGERTPSHLVPNAAFLTLIAAILLGTLYYLWGDIIEALRPYLNYDTYTRLTGSDAGTASERLMLARAGWELFTEHPIVGAGFATTRLWGYGVSVHNMFVLLLAEFGLVGAVWYAAFLARAFAMPLRFGAVVGTLLVVESLFTHSYFDLFYYVLLILIYWRVAQIVCEQGFTCVTLGERTYRG